MATIKDKSKEKAQLRKTSGGADPKATKRLTSERISSDMADFEQAGGEVEVLGTTRVLTKFDGNAVG